MTHSPRPSVRSGEISLADIALGLLLIAAGAASRIWFRDIPNFQPVAAIGLFAGYYFRSRWLAGAVPLAALVASDLVIGGYQWQMMVVVYAMIALPALVGPALRRFFPLQTQSPLQTTGSLAGLLGASLLAAILFFLSTNFAWWPWSSMYDKNLSGLFACYLAGLPFFRYTLAANALFGLTLFGSLALAAQLGWRTSPVFSARELN